MLSSSLPLGSFEKYKRHKQGRAMVSSDLLTTSSNATDASPDVRHCLSELADGMTTTTRYSLSTTSSRSMARDNVAAVCTESIPSVYPGPHLPSLDSTSSAKNNELWPVDAQVCASAPYNKSAQLQNDLAVSGILSTNNPGDMATAPPDTSGGVSIARAPPLSANPIPMKLLHQRSLSPGAYFIDENGNSIPSYMSPEAIKARNLILKCDYPTRQAKALPTHRQKQVRHVSFSDESVSPKRRRVNADLST